MASDGARGSRGFDGLYGTELAAVALKDREALSVVLGQMEDCWLVLVTSTLVLTIKKY